MYERILPTHWDARAPSFLHCSWALTSFCRFCGLWHIQFCCCLNHQAPINPGRSTITAREDRPKQWKWNYHDTTCTSKSPKAHLIHPGLTFNKKNHIGSIAYCCISLCIPKGVASASRLFSLLKSRPITWRGGVPFPAKPRQHLPDSCSTRRVDCST